MNTNDVSIEDQLRESKPGLMRRAINGIQNYLIDTSAKIVCYTPIMTGLEISLGLSPHQIVRNRAISAATDFFVAKAYVWTAEKTNELLKTKDSAVGKYIVNTVAMIGVYSPPYAAILAHNGANTEQIISGLIKGAIVAMATSHLYLRYALKPWRTKWGYHTKKQNEQYTSPAQTTGIPS